MQEEWLLMRYTAVLRSRYTEKELSLTAIPFHAVAVDQLAEFCPTFGFEVDVRDERET